MKKSEYQRFSRRLKLPAARSSGQGCIKLRDFSLSSIGWRRGLGRGGAFLLASPLIGPLPTRSSRGEDGELDAALGKRPSGSPSGLFPENSAPRSFQTMSYTKKLKQVEEIRRLRQVAQNEVGASKEPNFYPLLHTNNTHKHWLFY